MWAKLFGGTNDDVGLSVQETVTGGFVMTGWTKSFGAKDEDFFLLKVDNMGTLIWARTLAEGSEVKGVSVQKTSDGGFVIAGDTQSSGAGSYDFFLTKLDSTGKLLWAETLGGTSDDLGRSVQETADKGFIIVGYTAGNGGVLIAKVDTLGTLLWAQTLRGAGNGRSYPIQKTIDDGFIIVGYTGSFKSGGPDVFLAKVSGEGMLFWAKAFGGRYDNYGESVQKTSDGGFVIVGYADCLGTGVRNILLAKVNANGGVSNCSIMQDITDLVTMTDVTTLLAVKNVTHTLTSVNPNITDVTNSFIVQDVSLTETKICSGVSSGPTVTDPITDKTIDMGETTLFQFNADTFSNPNGGSLTYSASLEDNTPLPNWITFDANTRTFTMDPTIGVQRTISIKVTAKDSNGGTVSDIFAVNVKNANPIVEHPIPEQIVHIGSTVEFQIPADTFRDLNGDSLSYTATLSNGDTLPDWISFNATDRTFIIRSTEITVVNIKVTAEDGDGGTASDVFDIIVSNETPTSAGWKTPVIIVGILAGLGCVVSTIFATLYVCKKNNAGQSFDTYRQIEESPPAH